MGMQIVAIGGSVRPDNFTWKALSIVVDELKRNKDIGLDVFDPRNLDLAKPGLNPTSGAEKLKRSTKPPTLAMGSWSIQAFSMDFEKKRGSLR